MTIPISPLRRWICPRLPRLKRFESSFPKTRDWALHSSPPPPQQPFVALTHTDPPKPRRIPFLLPASTTSLEMSSGSLLPTVCQGTFSYSSCACITPVLRGPPSLVSGFGVQTSLLLLIHAFHCFVDFHPISLSRGLNVEVCSLQQPLAPHSTDYFLTLL